MNNGNAAAADGKKLSLYWRTAGIIPIVFAAFVGMSSAYPHAGTLAPLLIAPLAFAACVLMFAPGFALLLLAGDKIPASLAPGVVIVGSAAAGWLLFWSWFAGHTVGIGCSLALLALATFVLASKPVRVAWQQTRLPFVVSVLICIGYLALAGDRGGLSYGDQLITGRYWAVLDNAIPRMFADCLIRDGAGLKPFLLADWHSSDRPPLQTGMTLAIYPFIHQSGAPLASLFLSVAVNIFWVGGLWGFLRAVGCSEQKILQAVILTALVGAVFINSVYTWPKMLAAAIAFTAGTALLAADYSKNLRALIFGSAAALSLLAHGAAIFALMGLATIFWTRRNEWRIRDLATAAVIAALIYFPWSAYQKFYDPPGDRLIKWHLAGVIALDEKHSALATIVKEYKKSGGVGFVANRVHNLRMLIGDATDWNGECANGYAQPGWNDSLAGQLRQFFSLRLGPAPMLLLLGVPLLFFRRVRMASWFKPLVSALVTTLLAFLVIEFGSNPSSAAWLTHAPYTALILWCGLSALAITSLGDRWFYIFLTLHLTAFVALWVHGVEMWSAGKPPAYPGNPSAMARLVAVFSLAVLTALVVKLKQPVHKTGE